MLFKTKQQKNFNKINQKLINYNKIQHSLEYQLAHRSLYLPLCYANSQKIAPLLIWFAPLYEK